MKSHLHHFYHWETHTPNAPFVRQPYGDSWRILSYAVAGQEIRKMATALQAMDLVAGSHIGILSKNCYHWVLADFAIAMAGYVSVPFYASLKADEIEQVLGLGDVDALFAGKLETWEDKKAGIPADMPVIRFPYYEGNAAIDRGQDWEDFLQGHEPMTGQPHPPLEQLWTIIFTSGTTGVPKGVMHSFANSAGIIEVVDKYDLLGSRDLKEVRYLSYLPLNHVADRSTICAMILMGGSISFVESLESFGKNLADTQPTLFLAVPRIWTKFQMAVLEKLPQKRLNLLLSLPVIGSLIKRKIKKSMGLSAAVRCITSTAITPEPLKRWYKKLGVTLLEAYGMTETTGPFTLMPYKDVRPDCVGTVLPTGELRIDSETGEICKKAPWLMDGYYKDPERTALALRDGWLHTGDKGEIDTDGYLKIVGRVSDTFKTAKGEFIIPSIIEKHFSGHEWAEQVCVVGLGMVQPMLLVVLSDVGKQQDRSVLERYYADRLSEVNGSLQNYERLSRLILIEEPWTEQNGKLTPTMKVKRGVVWKGCQESLDSWKATEKQVIWA